MLYALLPLRKQRGRVGGKTVNARVGEDQGNLVSSRHDQTTVFMNSQLLQLAE